VGVIDIPDGSLEYVDIGRGAPLIFLHGGTGTIAEWGDTLSHFADKYRVLAYNRRGYGNSTPRTDFPPTYHRSDVADLLAFLDALKLDGPVGLCGFSDGATIALMFAARFPTRVHAVVSVSGHIYVEEKTQEGLLRAKRLFESGLRRKGVDEGTAKIQGRRAWFDLWLDKAFREWFDIGDELEQIRCPVLVMQGTEDEYAEVEHARQIAAGIRNSQLCLVEGAKHWIHGGDQAGLLLQTLSDFLEMSGWDGEGAFVGAGRCETSL
jgi:pimeloyl-ACP methyl ester carboxylesterase